MLSKREFLCAAGPLVAAALTSSVFAQSKIAIPATSSFGLQLFTLFDVLDGDVKAGLQRVAEIGYRDLQSSYSHHAGIYGMTPRAFASMVADLGMGWSSHHVPGVPRKVDPKQRPSLDIHGKPRVFAQALNLQENLHQIIDQVSDGGPRYLVCAGVPTATFDEVQASIELLNRAGEACKKAGLRLALHNHETEFKSMNGTTPYELILRGTSSANLIMELDIAWAVKAGVDPVDLFQRHPGRFGLWHVKDIDAQRRKPLPLGQGTVDFRRIFAFADVAGMQHFYVEHDFPDDPFASINTSMQYLRRLFGTG